MPAGVLTLCRVPLSCPWSVGSYPQSCLHKVGDSVTGYLLFTTKQYGLETHFLPTLAPFRGGPSNTVLNSEQLQKPQRSNPFPLTPYLPMAPTMVRLKCMNGQIIERPEVGLYIYQLLPRIWLRRHHPRPGWICSARR